MDFLKFLEKSLGGLLIFLSLMTIFTGLFFTYTLENIGIMTDSIDTKVLDILQQNKNLIAESIFKDSDIDKGYLKMACDQNIGEIPEEFCSNIDNLKNEDETKNALVEIMILKIKDQITPELKEVQNQVKSKMDEGKQSLNYVIPIGLLMFLSGSFIIFLAEKFKWKPALFCISLKTGMISAFAAVSNYFILNLTPENLEKIITMIPAVKGEDMPELALKLISGLFLDCIKALSKELFLISLITTVVSLLIALVMFILKCKKPVKVEKVQQKKVKKKVRQKKGKKTSAKKNAK